ncbi:N-acetyl-gamma-glutamyl-phosphate reductase [Bifidobacterium aquikefiricola]|uniref:N-acetyl-gamma-glutamyl-phosphate reductase n=1 Tax=Bifidobacterium aquikefiricola TaxID=3059038 RepID=A0AB39U4F6_9BIFI
MARYSVAVAGATGYAGGEALRILATHPNMQVTCVTGHSSIGHRLGEYLPHIPTLANLEIQDTTPDVLNGHDIIILALPHGASGALAAQLDDSAVVVDLGADHRLEEQEMWDSYYGGAYASSWTYGLPEMIASNDHGRLSKQRDSLRGATRIAGPGCNVTAVTLAFQPAIAHQLVDEHDIVADLAVAYSGAGKNLKRMNLLAAEAFNSATPYSVGGTHRHIPEMLQNLTHAAGRAPAQWHEISLGFTPMLVPMSRGILATVSAHLSDAAMQLSDAEIRACWENLYDKEHFVSLLPEGVMPATQNIVGSNCAHLQTAIDRNSQRLYAFAAIDNLNRGTAGQAIQSLNIALGLNEITGLTTIGVAP